MNSIISQRSAIRYQLSDLPITISTRTDGDCRDQADKILQLRESVTREQQNQQNLQNQPNLQNHQNQHNQLNRSLSELIFLKLMHGSSVFIQPKRTQKLLNDSLPIDSDQK